MTSSSPPWNGWTGSTIAACSNLWATFHPWSSRTRTTITRPKKISITSRAGEGTGQEMDGSELPRGCLGYYALMQQKSQRGWSWTLK